MINSRIISILGFKITVFGLVILSILFDWRNSNQLKGFTISVYLFQIIGFTLEEGGGKKHVFWVSGFNICLTFKVYQNILNHHNLLGFGLLLVKHICIEVISVSYSKKYAKSGQISCCKKFGQRKNPGFQLFPVCESPGYTQDIHNAGFSIAIWYIPWPPA